MRIFLGDSKEDFISSKKTNTIFVLKEHKENKQEFQKIKIPKIKSFLNFEKKISNLISN